MVNSNMIAANQAPVQAPVQATNVGSLDTLAQLASNSLLKRAKAKYQTQQIVWRLASLNSPLKQQYWNAYHCASVLVQNTDDSGTNKTTAKYCGLRCCTVCNRIRTAKHYHSYQKQLNETENLKFVTLTIKNVSSEYLRAAIDKMLLDFKKINDYLKNKYDDIVGLRKLEVTFNQRNNEFHPHFHILVNGTEKAEYFIKRWLELNPMANEQGQNIRDTDSNSLNELLKYATKSSYKIGKENVVNVEALDIIYQSLQGKRTVQPFGKLKKANSKVTDEQVLEIENSLLDEQLSDEQLSDLTAQTYSMPYYESMIWRYKKNDWINDFGEPATGFIPKKNHQLVFR